jgi:hypothetical protein
MWSNTSKIRLLTSSLSYLRSESARTPADTSKQWVFLYHFLA